MRFTSSLAAIALLLAPIGVLAQTDTAPANPPAQSAPAQVSPTLPSGTVILRMKYTQGEVLKYHMTMGSTISTSMNGTSMPMSTSTDMMMTQTVQSVDADGNATIISQVDNPVMTMNMNGKSIPMPASATNMLKSGFTTVMSPTGKTLSFKMNGAEAGTSASAAAGIQGMSGMFNSGQFGNVSMLPDHPVKAGDVWRSTAKFAAFGMTVYGKMALIGLDTSSGSTVANIALKEYANMQMPKASGAAGMSFQISGAGNSKFDIDRGELTSTSMVMNMDGSKAKPASLNGTQFGMKMTMNMEMDLVSGG